MKKEQKQQKPEKNKNEKKIGNEKTKKRKKEKKNEKTSKKINKKTHVMFLLLSIAKTLFSFPFEMSLFYVIDSKYFKSWW